MRVFYDLHIHSALSPCGDNDMTPNNVINMSKLNNLDVISLTDHNACFNVPAFSKVARDAGIVFIPGIELNTAEEVHLLGYFPDDEKACRFGEYIYDSLPDFSNNKSFFGEQLVMDASDNIIGEKDKLLINALPFVFDECIDLICQYGGVPVPAHINKTANSLLNNLGFIPESDKLAAMEYRPEYPIEADNKYLYITSSDAHYLENISDAQFYLDLQKNSLSEVLKFISRK